MERAQDLVGAIDRVFGEDVLLVVVVSRPAVRGDLHAREALKQRPLDVLFFCVPANRWKPTVTSLAPEMTARAKLHRYPDLSPRGVAIRHLGAEVVELRRIPFAHELPQRHRERELDGLGRPEQSLRSRN